MSTNANIAIQNKDGSFDRIWVHWDGGLETLGKILKLYYHDYDRVRGLVDLGFLDHVGPILEQNPMVKKYGFDLGALDDKKHQEFKKLPVAKQLDLKTINNNLYTEALWRDYYSQMSEDELNFYHETDSSKGLSTKNGPVIRHFEELEDLDDVSQGDWCEYLYVFKKTANKYIWYVNGYETSYMLKRLDRLL